MQEQILAYEPLMDKCIAIWGQLSNDPAWTQMTQADKEKKKVLMRQMFSYQELENIVDRYEKNTFNEYRMSNQKLTQTIIERLKLGSIDFDKMYTPEMEETRRKRLSHMTTKQLIQYL